MTGEQKQQIFIMRKNSLSFADIAEKTGLTKSAVKTFCWRNNLTDAEMQKYASSMYLGFCKHCGEPLQQKPKSRPKKFCSDKCRFAWWREHPEEVSRKRLITIKCDNCGQEFSCYPSQKHRFCSHACFIQFYFYADEGDD